MADQGFGTSITFNSSLLTGQLVSVGISGMAREPLDTTVMDSTNGWMTFIPSDLKDAGEVSAEIKFDPHTKLAAIKTALNSTAETITVTFPVKAGGSVGATWACNGFMTSFDQTSEMGSIITGTVGLKFSGEPTLTNGS